MVGTHDYSHKVDLIDSLMQAIEDSLAVSMSYHPLRASEPVTYTVWSYGLAYHRGSLYLVGRTQHQTDIRHWKVDRMQTVETTETHCADASR